MHINGYHRIGTHNYKYNVLLPQLTNRMLSSIHWKKNIVYTDENKLETVQSTKFLSTYII